MPSPLLVEALTMATETEALIQSEGAVVSLGALFRDRFSGLPARIIGAEDTWLAAGEAVQASLTAAGVPTEVPLLFPSDPFLHCDYAFIVQIRDLLLQSRAVPIAVGSGTINDLVKRAAFEVGRPYLCVATASSVDGFTSSGAAILKDGFKQTLPCPAPVVVIADPSILRKAPAYLTSSGYGDLASKIIAGADWYLADAVGADPIHPFGFRLTQEELRDRLSRPAETLAGDSDAVLGLFEGLAMTGFAMQFLKSSRPVSGCEHLFSHIWEMEDLQFGGRPVTHGHKVALGTLIATAFYEVLLSRGLASVDTGALGRVFPNAPDRERQVRRQFEGSPAAPGAVKAAAEVAVKKLNATVAAERVAAVQTDWAGLAGRLKSQLIPYPELEESFRRAGCPTCAEEIGLTRDYAIRTAYRAQMIRDRYSVLDLLFDAGHLDEAVSSVLADGRYLSSSLTSSESRTVGKAPRHTVLD